MLARTRYAPMLEALWRREVLLLNTYWVSTARLDGPRDLAGFDRIWLVPGSPYRSEAGVVSAVRTARERGRELPRQPASADRSDVTRPRGPEGSVHIEPGSLAEEALGARTTVERYQCTYALDLRYAGTLRDYGLRFTGQDDGHPRIAELPGHRFFLSTLFQPELAVDTSWPRPLVRAFASAAVGRSTKT
ncbi:hypothetical protein [Streptomyces cyaneofuscatus]|uniref:hypothetical protein n=1 Tax=Streptomyces cyaneofuscatus TaxID=66883 RepID=UPI003795E373